LKQGKEVYDISVLLGVESIDWPDAPPYSREMVMRIEDGDIADLSKLVMTTHAGTHVDVPAHFIRNGKNLDAYPIEKWILPPELEKLGIKPGDALLFKTDNSISGRCANGVFSEEFVYLS